MDVLPEFVAVYNDTDHSTTGMALANVGDPNILNIWRMNNIKLRVVKPKFIVDQHIR
jgi:hypothetical protein